MKQLLLIATLTVLLGACRKDNIRPTSAEETANELQRVISSQQIDRVYPFQYPGGAWASLPASAGATWTFSNGYLNVYNFSETYNLEYLYYYQVSKVTLDNGKPALALLLYFK